MMKDLAGNALRFSLFSCVFCFSQSSFAAEPLNFLPSIAVGYYHVCAADGLFGNAPQCLSDPPNQLNDPPADVATVVALSAGNQHTCAIHYGAEDAKRKVTCWGSNQYNQLAVPPAKDDEEPIELVSTTWSSCALWRKKDKTDTKIRCWGGDPAINNVPSLKGPLHIEATDENICTTVSENNQALIRCWGDLNVSLPGKLYDLIPGDRVRCKKYREGILCDRQVYFRQDSDEGDAFTLRLSRSRQVKNQPYDCIASPGKNNDTRLTCNGGTINYSVAGYTYDYGIGADRFCLLHNLGVVCRKFDGKDFLIRPFNDVYLRKDLYFTKPSDIKAIVAQLISNVYSFDADFFREISSLLANASDGQLLMTARALSPLLANFSYRGFAESRMTKMKDSIQKVLGDDAQAVVASGDDHAFLLKLLASCIKTMRPVLLRVDDETGTSQVHEAEEIVALLGQAIATRSPVDPALKERLRSFWKETALNSYVGDRATVIAWLTERI